MGLISTIIITNNSVLDKYQSNNVNSYHEFIKFLSEESALTKKTIAWFIGNDAQSINYLKNNQWLSHELEGSYYPIIKNTTLFKDSHGKSFVLSENVETPFLIFYPSGRSSGGFIKFNESNKERILLIDTFGKVTDSENNYVSTKRF